jgi:alpha-L-fucosidase
LDIGAWLETNGEAIYGTRPWKVFGEGPTKLAGGDFAEEKHQGFTAEDVRFTAKESAVYCVCLGWPAEEVRIKALGLTAQAGTASPAHPGKITAVRLLGSDENLKWTQGPEALVIQAPTERPVCAGRPCGYAYTFKAVGAA